MLSSLPAALALRADLVDTAHLAAFRAFAGFYEGAPSLAIDLFGKSVVLYDHSDSGDEGMVTEALAAVRAQFPFVTAALWKVRNAKAEGDRQGRMLWGEEGQLCRRIVEHGVRYRVDLRLNHDVGFYLDTRAVRGWAKEHLQGKLVLNTFAYTGSLGVASRGGGATRVVQTDLNRVFLDFAKDSYTLNGFPIDKSDFQPGDFFNVTGRLKREGALFDCVFIDPPFFSTTAKGTVDLSADPRNLIDKVRPLVAHNGWLVVANNALYLPGAAFDAVLTDVCADGYATLVQRFDVPDDVRGYASSRVSDGPADPAPFNHPTKLALLQIQRKDERKASIRRW